MGAWWDELVGRKPTIAELEAIMVSGHEPELESDGRLAAVKLKVLERPKTGYWNGEPTSCEVVRVIVGPSPVDTWWCAGLEGTEREAVRVEYPGGDPFYLDNEDGKGWAKVTEGFGSPRWSHRSLPVEKEVS